jgi:hypothetical protein
VPTGRSGRGTIGRGRRGDLGPAVQAVCRHMSEGKASKEENNNFLKPFIFQNVSVFYDN